MLEMQASVQDARGAEKPQVVLSLLLDVLPLLVMVVVCYCN